MCYISYKTSLRTVVLKISENMKKYFSDRYDFELKLVCNFTIKKTYGGAILQLRWCYTVKRSRNTFSQNSSGKLLLLYVNILHNI